MTCTPIGKDALVAISRALEEQALASPPAAMASALQDGRFVSDRTRDVYAQLASSGTRVKLYARGLQTWLAPGVIGISLDDDDPLVDEWAVVIPSDDDPVVLAATDLGAGGDGIDRQFLHGVSRDPEVVAECARLLGAVIETAQ
jgi:DICT domain-containing protein